MSRVIKFRVWDGQWIEWASFTHNTCIGVNEIFEQKGYVFEQWTGLLDKNGKEIYEGDIVERIHSYCRDDIGMTDRVEYVDMTGVLVYSTEKAAFEIHEKRADGLAMAWFGRCFMSNAGLYLYRVIGNIHENPDLLK